MSIEARRIRKKSATSAVGLETLADLVAITLLALGTLCSAASLLMMSWLG